MSEPLPLVIIGLNFGRHICEELSKPENSRHVKLAGVCDLDASKAAELSSKYGIPAYPSLDAVLADPKVPAVGLFTGPVGRAELIGRIIRAGKDLMTTKPFERDSGAARSILDEAAALGRVIHLNSPAPTLPGDLAVVDGWRNEHQLGRLVAARSEVWVSYREPADGSWYDDPVRCPVPPIYRLGVYLINDLVRLGGKVSRVHVEQSRLFTGRPTADHAEMLMRFADGGLASIFATFCVEDGDHYRHSMTLRFEKGSIYRNVGPERGSAKAELALVMGTGQGGRSAVHRATSPDMSGGYQWEEFARAVAAGRPLAPEVAATAVEGLRVIEAMAASAASGAPVELDHV